MAKKKNKKGQKPVDFASPPPSPKPAAEEPPAVPTDTPLSPETTATETTHDDFQSVASPSEPKFEDSFTDEPLTETQKSIPSNTTDRKAPVIPKEEDAPIENIPETSTSEPLKPSVDSTESGKKDDVSSRPELATSEPAEILSNAKGPASTARVETPRPKATEQLPSEVASTDATAPQPTPVLPAQQLPSESPAISQQKPPSSSSAPQAFSEAHANAHTVSEPPPAPAVAIEVPPPSVPSEAVRETVAASPPASTSNPERATRPFVTEKNVESEPSAPEAHTDPSNYSASTAPKSQPSAPASTTTSPSPVAPEPSQLKSPPKPGAVKQVIEESRPPAPTPPVNNSRPRHSPAFDSDDDDDLLIHPRLRADRDPSRGLTYPPQQSHPRLFASRVPTDQYSNPTPAHPPPPGYHPRYYPSGAPPYYPNQNHSMSQYGQTSHASSPYQESWNQFPPTYPQYGSPPRHDSVGSREYSMGPRGIENGTAIEDDSGDLFSRITQAIPDLHMLLNRYRETHGQLGAREEVIRRAGFEQQERLRFKDDEINGLKMRVNDLENKHSGEANRLRLELGNMEEQVKELREQNAKSDKVAKELEDTYLALAAVKAAAETQQKELEGTIATLEMTMAEDRERAQREFEEWKTTTTTKHDAEKIALAIQFDKKLKEADVLADAQRQESAAAFIKEKDELRSEHQRQQREREESFDRVRNELEAKLNTAQKVGEEALKHQRESREVWEGERTTLVKAHQEDLKSQTKGWDDQRALLETNYKKIKEESDRAWIELHGDANRRAEQERTKVDTLSREKDELQKKVDELKSKQEKEKAEIQSVTSNLVREKERLDKLLGCYGDIAEIKSKGDAYYVVSFRNLEGQIMDLATSHFIHLPVSPPPEDLAQIPSSLPSFLGDTTASRQLRAAYIAHTVSKMVTFRVFGPFLFSLGRRYDKADSLFSSMSSHIRDKSSRKEAIWRQQTLLAAFTSSGAKQRINTAAGTVVDEIVMAIKNFADPREEEGIRIAVRKIVKTAAETWRFARLEREMITAIMPALDDGSHEFAPPNFWREYKPAGTPIPSLVGTTTELDGPSNEHPVKLILRLFPVIHREPKHESSRSSTDEKPDEGSIFNNGLALYEDSEAVLMRVEELKQAGLSFHLPEAPLLPHPRQSTVQHLQRLQRLQHRFIKHPLLPRPR
ncbi:hypothetical protein EJ04DRAFT_356084 [Polyplosphaeria fusca]|uniref:Uncharacterized protein n=1 Tax=Polyplosphaeria fusca TaxID=682080 RepID=A0A9P4R9G0_9PLEO|nr:hypothetical protein EJ04DRAFT_356084 [Polyplosphaeria fusca]